MHEHDHVRILLDCAGFADVREHRAVVGAPRGRAGELLQRDHRHAQLDGQRLQCAGDLRDLLLTAAEVAGRAHQREIVDHDDVQAVLQLQSSGLGAHLGDGDARRCVHIDGRGADADHRVAELAPVLVADLAPAHLLHVHARLGAQHAHGKLLGGHLQREHRRLLARADRRVFDEVHADAGLAHGGSPGHQDHLARMEAGQQLVQLGIAGLHAVHLAVVLHQQLDLLKGLEQHRLDRHQLLAALAHGDVVDQLLRFLQHLLRLPIPGVAGLGDLLGGRDQLAQRGLLVHDLDVRPGVDRRGHAAAQLDQIGRAAHRVQLAPPRQLLVQRDQVDGARRRGQGLHRGIDLAVRGIVEIAGLQRLDGEQGRLAGAKHRAQHAALRFRMARHALGVGCGDVSFHL